MKSLTMAIALLFSTLALAAQAPSGQLSFALRTAGPSVVLTGLPHADVIYRSLTIAIQAPILDGAVVLDAMRKLESEMAPLKEVIGTAVENAIDPKHIYNHFFDIVEASDMKWTIPIVQYAAGDDSDDEPIYVTANHELRGSNSHSQKTLAWTTSMRQALSHLPKIEGLFFRGSRLAPERVAKYYQVGKPASDLAFISSSLEPSTAFRFATPGVNGDDADDKKKIAIIIVILGKTGRPVSTFAHMHEHEEEILYANGTPMTVKAMSKVFDDTTLGRAQVVYLVESEPK